jgi:methionyl-tRNA formyltransferase
MPGARVAVFGYADVGHACLAHLLYQRANVVAVYTHRDAPGERPWFPSVHELAAEHGIPVHLDADFSRAEALDCLRVLEPALILSFYYRSLLPGEVLAIPRLGAFNIHGSLLPRYRGRAPVNWAVLNGEVETGATLHAMSSRADTGDIVDQERVPIGPDDTAAQVQACVREAAVLVLGRQLDALLHGDAPQRPQDEALATTFGRRRPEDGAFEWSWPARRIHDLVRAVTHPYPGATAVLGGRPVHVWRTRVEGPGVQDARGIRPGEMRLIGNELHVACGDGRWIEIVCGQLEGDVERLGWELACRFTTQP